MILKLRLDEGALIPKAAHASDVGYDLYAAYGTGVKRMNRNTVMLDTGVHIELPDGYYAEVVPNSRISKSPFMFANSVGIIDPGYRGSIKVALRYTGGILDWWRRRKALADYVAQVRPVAQLIVRKRYAIEGYSFAPLSKTARGEGGFGSTEKGGQA